jgi:hypothetical protein
MLPRTQESNETTNLRISFPKQNIGAAPPTYDATADHPCSNQYRTRRGN